MDLHMDRTGAGLRSWKRVLLAVALVLGGLSLVTFGPAPSAGAQTDIDDFIDDDGNLDLERYNCEVLGNCGVAAGNAGPSCGAVATAAGDEATITLPGYAVGSTLTVTIFSDPVVIYDGPVTSDPQVITFTVPDGFEPGTHRIEAVGVNADDETLVTDCPEFQVLGSTLPRTGSDPGVLVGAGAALFVLGSAVLYGTRRRRNATVAG